MNNKIILFICQANVGRSQMAEAFYNHLTHTQNATSAGIEDLGQKYQFRPTNEIIEAMAEKGIDISGQRIKQIQKEMLIQASKIVVLCNKDLCPKYLLSNPKVIFREVTDPFQLDKQKIRNIRDEIEKIVTELI